MSFKMGFFDEANKGFGKVYTRLFSHSYHAKNEIKYMLHELELRYNEQEMYYITDVSAAIEKLNENKVENCKNLLEKDLKSLIDSINGSSKHINDVLELSNEEHKSLQIGREERKNLTEQLKAHVDQRIEDLNIKYANIAKELEEKYKELDN